MYRAAAAAAAVTTGAFVFSDPMYESVGGAGCGYASCDMFHRGENVSSGHSVRKKGLFFPGAYHSLNRLHHHSKLDLELEQAQVVFTSGARIPASPIVSKSNMFISFYPADTNREGLNLASVLFYRGNNLERSRDQDGQKLMTRDHVQNEINSTISRSLLHKNGVRPSELTRKGQLQAIDLGKRLRDRYRGRLIPSMWGSTCNDLIRTKSLLSESCINTAQGVLTGLYEGRISDEIPALINVKPLKEEEWMQAAAGNWCPILQKLFFSAMHVSAGKLLETKEGKELTSIMNDKLGFQYEDGTKIDSVISFLEFRDQIVSTNIHSNNKPSSFQALEDRLNELASKQIFQACSGGNEDNRVQVTRLLIGRFLRRIVDNLCNEPSERLQLYSIDDITMMTLYMCIDPYGNEPGLNTRRWPNVCDELSFELWRDRTSGTKLVRVLLHGEAFHLPGIPCATGGSFYDIDTFRNALQKYILFDEDIESSCLVPTSTTTSQ